MLEAKRVTIVTALNKEQQVAVRLRTKAIIDNKANFVDGLEIPRVLIDATCCEPLILDHRYG